MVPDANMSSLGLEYFCNLGDEMWCMPDAELVELGKRELEKIGLAKAADVVDGCVYRVEKTYPVYDSTYQQHVDVIKSYIAGLENFQTIGRNGLHRYNNQDHAMLTGMYAVRNILYGEDNNLWGINAEQDYHEEIRKDRDPIAEKIIDHTFPQIFTRLEPFAFAAAHGVVSGFSWLSITVWVVLNQLQPAARFVGLLGQYFPGYEVSLFPGAPLSLIYGFLLGFLLGWLFAFLRNGVMSLYISNLWRQVEAANYEESSSSG